MSDYDEHVSFHFEVTELPDRRVRVVMRTCWDAPPAPTGEPHTEFVMGYDQWDALVERLWDGDDSRHPVTIRRLR